MRTMLFSILVLCFFFFPLFADEIYLKDGKSIDCKILKVTPEVIIYNITGSEKKEAIVREKVIKIIYASGEEIRIPEPEIEKKQEEQPTTIEEVEESKTIAKRKFQSTIFLAYDGNSFSYKETQNGSVLDKDTGWINGVFIEYRGDTDLIFFRISTNISGSNSAKYDGALQNGYGNTTPYSTTTSEFFFQEEMNGGFKVLKLDSFVLSPYGALGYRYWLRGENKDYDYEETYTWLYAGIGLNLLFKFDDWRFGLEALFEYTINPEMKTNVNGNFDTATFKLKSRPACHIEASINYTFYKYNNTNLFLFINPYYQRWNIGASDAVTFTKNGNPYYYGYPIVAYEPDSHTDIYGFKIGVGITF